MKKKIQTITIVKIIALIMLFWALADNPYGYYQILRWVIAGVTGYSAYLAYEQGKNTWTWILAITAILFNPIAPIRLDRETWSIETNTLIFGRNKKEWQFLKDTYDKTL